jgi:hypothetical protein
MVEVWEGGGGAGGAIGAGIVGVTADGVAPPGMPQLPLQGDDNC